MNILSAEDENTLNQAYERFKQENSKNTYEMKKHPDCEFYFSIICTYKLNSLSIMFGNTEFSSAVYHDNNISNFTSLVWDELDHCIIQCRRNESQNNYRRKKISLGNGKTIEITYIFSDSD